MIADLHVHTTLSDGAHSPTEAVRAARARGLHAVAITDHDTTAGADLCHDLGRRAGIEVIRGVEVSAYDFRAGRRIHILGYGYRTPARAIERLCRPVREARDAMTRSQIETLRRAGYPVEVAAVEEVASAAMNDEERALWPGVLYKQHVMAVLVARGAADALYGETYRSLFKGEGICAGEITYVDAFDAVAAIASDGGVAVLAHPGQQESYDLVPRLAAAGLGGIELYHEDHGPRDHRRVLALAGAHGLMVTGGSDAHGALGSIHAIGNIVAPDGAAESLIARSGDAGRTA